MSGMTSPPEDDLRQQVPPYVALVRIAAVIGMSAALAFAIFLLIAGYWLWGLVSFACALPFFGLMRLVEGTAEDFEPPG